MLKLTIITPNYNYSRYIGQTIESVIKQDYSNIEYIIVDDGSTDNSVEIIHSYVNRYPSKITLITQSNKGQTKAINKALSVATGDILVWINSDDYFCNNIFSKIIQEFNNDVTLDAVFGDIKIVNEKGNIVKVNRYLNFDYPSGVFNGFGKIIPSNAIFWKKKLTESIGFMNENFHYAMDSEYWSRLLFNRKIKHIPLVIASFRWHENAKTITRKNKASMAHKIATKEDKFVFENAYRKLIISKYIPQKYSFFLKIYFKFKRILLRFLNGHYFYYEKN